MVLCLTLVAGYGTAKAGVKRLTYRPQTRTYYIAAENVDWDFAPGGKDLATGRPIPAKYQGKTQYQMARYIQYTNDTFTQPIPQPEQLGILGPIIRGVPGDTIKVVFRNMTDKPYSMHPHGLQYEKASEGSVAEMGMEDESAEGGETTEGHSMSGSHLSASAMAEMEENEEVTTGGTGNMPDQAVFPGAEFTYTWQVRDSAGPQAGQGSSRVWLYHSHVAPQDIYDGLVGAIVITDPAHARADATPDDVDHEFFSLFMIFDKATAAMNDEEHEAAQVHAVNGRFFDTLKGYTMRQGDRVRWYEMGLGNEVDVHTAHWHGNVVRENGLSTDVIELMPASMRTVDMVPDAPGTWAYHCHVLDHMEAGMMTEYTVTPRE